MVKIGGRVREMGQVCLWACVMLFFKVQPDIHVPVMMGCVYLPLNCFFMFCKNLLFTYSHFEHDLNSIYTKKNALCLMVFYTHFLACIAVKKVSPKNGI